MRLKQDFFNRKTVDVAQELLGKFLVRKIGRKVVVAQITETEAYDGPHDRASHASRGRTPRTEIMFGPPGYTYVYMIYGMYHCLNFVTREVGYPAAVLIRALDRPDANGPGKLCKTFQIDRRLNGLAPKNNQLWVEDRGIIIKKSQISKNPRIGVSYAGTWQHKPWRFRIIESK
jgi:DNA-3-methyladenine glycosylase